MCCGPQGSSLALSWKHLAGYPLWKQRGKTRCSLCFFPALRFQLTMKAYAAGWEADDSFLVEGGGGSDDRGVNFKSARDWKGI